jgi:hypothetical protein
MSEEGLLTADNPTWYSADNAEFVTTKGWDSADSAISSYQELEKSMGGRIKMPTDESTPEERSAFYQKLGRPEGVDGYTRPELGEGQEYDEAFLGEMAAAAHEAGVTDNQFKKLIEKYIGNQEAQAEAKIEAETRESQATVEELQREWAGDYEKNLEISKRAIRELVPEDMKESFAEVMTGKNLDNNLTFIKTMHSIGKQLLDDTLVKGDQPKPTGDYVPANINSPEMYRFGEGEESKKARAYFEAQGFKY